MSTVYLLKRAELAARGCIEVALGECDLTPTQFFILLLLQNRAALSSAELARAMAVAPQSITGLIAPLERDGLIQRRENPDNRRILRIALTTAGLKVYRAAATIAHRLERDLLADFDKRELATFNRMLERLLANAQNHACHPRFRSARATNGRRRGVKLAAARRRKGGGPIP